MRSDADLLHLIIIYSLDGTAIAVNALLIGIIIVRTPPSMRAYSIILLHNALIDFISAGASAMTAERVICSSDGTMVEIYLGACSKIGGMPICNACQTTHMTFVNLSIAIFLISFHYRLRAISDSSVHTQSQLRVWLLCSITYVPVAGVWYLYYISARVTPEAILQGHGLSGKGYVTAWYTLADTAPVVSVIFIIAFSPSVMITVFFVRKRLLCRIAQTSVALQSQHKYIAMALTYHTLLPCTLAVSAIIWLLDVTGVYSSEWPQRMIMVSSSLFALVSPLINLSYLPPYRRFLTRRRAQKANNRDLVLDSRPTKKQVAPIPETSV